MGAVTVVVLLLVFVIVIKSGSGGSITTPFTELKECRLERREKLRILFSSVAACPSLLTGLFE